MSAVYEDLKCSMSFDGEKKRRLVLASDSMAFDGEKKRRLVLASDFEEER
jgi:hypothetical protein